MPVNGRRRGKGNVGESAENGKAGLRTIQVNKDVLSKSEYDNFQSLKSSAQKKKETITIPGEMEEEYASANLNDWYGHWQEVDSS